MRGVVLFLLYVTGIQYVVGSGLALWHAPDQNTLFTSIYLFSAILFVLFTVLWHMNKPMQIPLIILLSIEVVLLVTTVVTTPAFLSDWSVLFMYVVVIFINVMLCVYLYRSLRYYES